MQRHPRLLRSSDPLGMTLFEVAISLLIIASLHAGMASPHDLTPERCAQRFPLPR